MFRFWKRRQKPQPKPVGEWSNTRMMIDGYLTLYAAMHDDGHNRSAYVDRHGQVRYQGCFFCAKCAEEQKVRELATLDALKET